jgi:hypothetical protein
VAASHQGKARDFCSLPTSPFPLRQYNVPTIGFVNKMDRVGCSLVRTPASVEEKLKVKPVLLQQPLG